MLFVWSFEQAIGIYQRLSSHKEEVSFSASSLPSCKDDVFLDRERCYTMIYAPNSSEFRDVVGRMEVDQRLVRGFSSGMIMDQYLYENPNTVMAAVEFFKKDSRNYAFSVQTNGTARWFKGQFFSFNEYVQLPVIVAVQKALSPFLDGMDVSVGLVTVPPASAEAVDGVVVKTTDILLPLFYVSSMVLVLMMQVHDTVEKKGVVDVLVVHSLRRTAHYLSLVATWSSLCFWNSFAFVGTYSLFYMQSVGFYEVGLMMSCGQAMMSLGLVVGALVQKKGSVLGVGVLMFFWSWVSMVSGFSGVYTEWVTPWGVLVYGLREGGLATQMLMWLLSFCYTLLGWVFSARVWKALGRSGVAFEITDAKMGGLLIKVDNLSKRFGGLVALDDVSLELGPSQEKVILGTCSAGKSTLLKSILDEGCPFIRRKRGLAIGYCPQESLLFEHLAVDEWLHLVNAIRHNEEQMVEVSVDKRIICELNAGERRWLCVQTAIMGMLSRPGAALILLDEPTSEMNPKLKRMTWKKIQELKEAGCSVLVATHDVDEAERGDEIVVLARGTTVFTGTELEMRRRFGCGYQLNVRAVPSMVQNVQGLVIKTLGGKTSKQTSSDGYCTFEVPHEMEDRLPGLLTTLDMNKSTFGVEDVQLRSTTISHSFMSLIRQVELEAAVREGRYELLLVAEENIALKIPIGSELVESPSGYLYQLVWSPDPRGRLTIASYSLIPSH